LSQELNGHKFSGLSIKYALSITYLYVDKPR